MPEVTGSVGGITDGANNAGLSFLGGGAFVRYVSGMKDGYSSSRNNNPNYHLSFALSRGNNLYGKSSSVTPLSRKTSFLIKF